MYIYNIYIYIHNLILQCIFLLPNKIGWNNTFHIHIYIHISIYIYIHKNELPTIFHVEGFVSKHFYSYQAVGKMLYSDFKTKLASTLHSRQHKFGQTLVVSQYKICSPAQFNSGFS